MQRLFRLGASLVGAGGGPPLQWEVDGRRLVEERPISEGGFAFVVQVRDVDTGEVFALKKIICQEPEAIQTAKREASVLENLPSHKNIVGYYGYAVLDKGVNGCAHHQVLMLMELCTGGTLLDFLEGHNGRIPEGELMRAMTDIAEAIFCLHSHSPPLQHRDLKLENILRGSDGFWKIIDFGSWSDQPYDLSTASTKELSKLSDEITRNTTMMYRPPEMVDVYLRYPVSCAVDIWMLGCILFSLLYSRHPFQEASALAIREARYRLPQRSPAPSPMVIDLLVWLLAPDPRNRPSARKLVTMLWQWQDLPSLGLPQPVQEHKTKLLATWSSAGGPAASAGAATRGGGQRRGEAAAARQPPARQMPRSGTGAAASTAQGGGTAGASSADTAAAAAAVAAADAAAAAATPWTASFGDFGGAGGGMASPGAAQSEDFQGFQAASADPSPPLEEPAAPARSGAPEALAAVAPSVAVRAADPSPPLEEPVVAVLAGAEVPAAPLATKQADASPPAEEVATVAPQSSEPSSTAAAAVAASSAEVADASPLPEEPKAAAPEKAEVASVTLAAEMPLAVDPASPSTPPREAAVIARESVDPASAAEDTPAMGSAAQSPSKEEESAPAKAEELSAEPAIEAAAPQDVPGTGSSTEEPAGAILSSVEQPAMAPAVEAPTATDVAGASPPALEPAEATPGSAEVLSASAGPEVEASVEPSNGPTLADGQETAALACEESEVLEAPPDAGGCMEAVGPEVLDSVVAHTGAEPASQESAAAEE